MRDGGTIQSDVPGSGNGAALSVDEAANAFLKRWSDAEEPSEGDEEGQESDQEETTDTDPDSESEHSDEDDYEDSSDPDEEGSDDDDDEDEDDEENAPSKVASDDMLVTVVVDGESKQVSVKDLKRLYGQEASLTRKSQEVAAARKKAEEDGARYLAGLQKLVEKAEQRWKPYAEIDMLVASKQLSAEDFAQLRKDAQTAFEEYRFLTQELDGFMKAVQEERQKAIREQAAGTLKLLKDESSPYHIPGWSNELYDEIRSFAVSQGFDKEAVDTEVNPAAIKTLYMAMQYAKGKKIATEKKAKVAPKKVLKSKTGSGGSPKAASVSSAMVRLQKTGSVEDAAAAFLARWK